MDPGAVVWAKCGSHFWPAEVMDVEKLPEQVREDLDTENMPKYVVKFFDEDGYEYLDDGKYLFEYNCSRKEEFIKKGIAKSRVKSREGAKGSWFEKFPSDVVRSEKMTGGDEKILEKEPYVEKKVERVNYKELFGSPQSSAGDKRGRKSEPASKRKGSNPSSPAKSKKAKESPQPARPISHPRFKPGGEQHQVRIMQQPSAPYHLDLQMKQEKNAASSPGAYTCHMCGFSASRLNVIVLHQKSHSEPARQKSAANTSRGRPTVATTPTPPTPSTPTRGRGRKKGSSTSPAPKVPTPPKQKRTATATTTAAKAEPTPPATPKRGRGRGKKNAESAVPAAASPPKEKKPRLTKKKKDQLAKEQEMKREERKKILGEWDEEEDGEAEEKKKLKEDSEDQSDGESDQEAYFQDDNIQGNVYGDDDDDEEEQEQEEAVSSASDKADEAKEEPDRPQTDQGQVGPGPETGSGENESSAAGEDKPERADVEIDIGQVLEDTKVPDLPPAPSKKSVKFPDQVAKEIAITKMALVQPETNMVNPMDVEDEFDVDDELDGAGFHAKTILKKPCEEEEEEEVVSSTTGSSQPEKEESGSADAGQVASEAESSAAATMIALGQAGPAQPFYGQEDGSGPELGAAVPTTSVEAVATTTTVESTTPADHPLSTTVATTESSHDGDTYFLLVDEKSGAQLDQLKSSQQTLYIDSSSLANGDLSNVVLVTGPPADQHVSDVHDKPSDEAPASNGHHFAENNGSSAGSGHDAEAKPATTS